MARRARERGRTAVDSAFLTEIRNESMLLVAKCMRGFGFEELSMGAFDVAKAKMRRLPKKLEVIDEIRAFLAERTERNAMVLTRFQRYLETIPARGVPWTEEALARIQRVPEPLRGRLIFMQFPLFIRAAVAPNLDSPVDFRSAVPQSPADDIRADAVRAVRILLRGIKNMPRPQAV